MTIFTDTGALCKLSSWCYSSSDGNKDIKVGCQVITKDDSDALLLVLT